MGFKTTYYKNGGKITKTGLQAINNPFLIKQPVNTGEPTPGVPTATVKAKAPNWLKHKRKFLKDNPQSVGERKKAEEMKYRELAAPSSRPSMHAGKQQSTDTEKRKTARKIIADKRNSDYIDYTANKLIEGNPQKGNRERQISKFSDQDLAIINKSKFAHKIKPTSWQSFEQGLLSLGNAMSPVELRNRNIDPREMKDYNILNVLDPLDIPGKVVQSFERDNYNVKDALKGKANNAGFAEQLASDPSNYLGLGLLKKGLKKGAVKAGSLYEAKNPLKNLFKNVKLNPLYDNTVDEVTDVVNSFRNRLSTPEGAKRMKNLGVTKKSVLDSRVVNDPDEVAYYSNNSTNVKTGSEKVVAINKNIDKSIIKPVTRHELEHSVQQGKLTEIDKSLDQLELTSGLEKYRKNELVRNPNKKMSSAELKSNLKDKTNAADYFIRGSGGKEKSAFLAELQQYAVDGKYVNHAYDKFTSKIVKKMFVENKINKDYPMRIFNIMKPTEANYKLLADNLNKMLTIGGAGAAGATLKNKDK